MGAGFNWGRRKSDLGNKEEREEHQESWCLTMARALEWLWTRTRRASAASCCSRGPLSVREEDRGWASGGVLLTDHLRASE